jgi:signal transduction histidine kinase
MRSYVFYQHFTDISATDKDRIVQVLSNLLSNSIKFAKKDGGKIFVTLEKKTDYFSTNHSQGYWKGHTPGQISQTICKVCIKIIPIFHY